VTEGLVLTDEEVKQNIKLAKEAATGVESDASMVGVRQAMHGKWMVMIGYQGKQHYIGGFETREQAIAANVTARSKLSATKEFKLTEREIKQNVKLAKEAASVGNVRKPGRPKRYRPVEHTTPGVQTTSSGKWIVMISYQGKHRYIGSFDTQDQARSANIAARGKLMVTEESELTDRAIERNVELAKLAAAMKIARVSDWVKCTQNTESRPAVKAPAIMAPVSRSDSGTSKSRLIKSRTPYVYAERSGKWKVEFSYQKKKRYFGSYSTVEEAGLASRVLRKELEESMHLKLSADEIKSNINRAKEAAQLAVSSAVDDVNNSMSSDVAMEVPPLIDSISRPDNLDTSRHDDVFSDRNSKAPSAEKDSLNDSSNPKTTSRKRKTSIRFESDKILGRLKKKTAIDRAGADDSDLKEKYFRTAGVRESPSGKWTLAIQYQGKKCYFGTFDTQNHAISASVIARTKLNTSKDLKLTEEEVKVNVKLAKEAVLNAVESTPSTSANEGVEEGEKNHSAHHEIDFTTVGVRQLRTGKWHVEICYKGRRGYMGPFDTRDNAILANVTARNLLKITRDSKLTAKEIELNLKLAKEAAIEAVRKSNEVGQCRNVVDKTSTKKKHRVKGGADHPKETDLSAVGVQKAKCGKWKVGTGYDDKRGYLGTFDTRDNAKRQLKTTAASKLNALKPAKEAAAKAVKIPIGVTATTSGKWSVEIDYQNSNHYIGTFSTKEQAMLVNTVARAELEATRDLKINADEIERNLELAEGVACKALLNRMNIKSNVEAEAPGCLQHKEGLGDDNHLTTSYTPPSLPNGDGTKRQTGLIAQAGEAVECVLPAGGRRKPGMHLENEAAKLSEVVTEAPALDNPKDDAGRKNKLSMTRIAVEVADTELDYGTDSGIAGALLLLGDSHVTNQGETRASQQEEKENMSCTSRLMEHNCNSKFLDDNSNQHNRMLIAETRVAHDNNISGQMKSRSRSGRIFLQRDEDKGARRDVRGGTGARTSGVATNELDHEKRCVQQFQQTNETSTLPDFEKLPSALSEPFSNDATAVVSPSVEEMIPVANHNNPRSGPGEDTSTSKILTTSEDAVLDAVNETEINTDTPTCKCARPTYDGMRSIQSTVHQSNNLCGQLVTANNAQTKSWFYVDHQGRIQGPYDAGQMRQWFESGYLRDYLQISQSSDGPFRPLSFYFPDRNESFANKLETEHPPQAQQISPSATWFYVDHAGRIQGPHRADKMRQWFESGYLSNDLQVSQMFNGPFGPLSSFFPDCSQAFKCLVMTSHALETDEEHEFSQEIQGSVESVDEYGCSTGIYDDDGGPKANSGHLQPQIEEQRLKKWDVSTDDLAAKSSLPVQDCMKKNGTVGAYAWSSGEDGLAGSPTDDKQENIETLTLRTPINLESSQSNFVDFMKAESKHGRDANISGALLENSQMEQILACNDLPYDSNQRKIILIAGTENSHDSKTCGLKKYPFQWGSKVVDSGEGIDAEEDAGERGCWRTTEVVTNEPGSDKKNIGTLQQKDATLSLLIPTVLPSIQPKPTKDELNCDVAGNAAALALFSEEIMLDGENCTPQPRHHSLPTNLSLRRGQDDRHHLAEEHLEMSPTAKHKCVSTKSSDPSDLEGSLKHTSCATLEDTCSSATSGATKSSDFFEVGVPDAERVDDTRMAATELATGSTPTNEHQKNSAHEGQTWFYVDHEGRIQGPYETGKMMQWFASGYLNDDLQISQTFNGPFQPLSSHVLDFPSKSDVGWFYIDHQGETQGPYGAGQMSQWFESDYIQADLQICQTRHGPFKPLYSFFPDCSKAFKC